MRLKFSTGCILHLSLEDFTNAGLTQREIAYIIREYMTPQGQVVKSGINSNLDVIFNYGRIDNVTLDYDYIPRLEGLLFAALKHKKQGNKLREYEYLY